MAELFFGDFRFDTRGLTLEGPKGEIEVRAKTLELLTFLIQHRNCFVPRDEIMQHLWPEVRVTTSSLTQCVSELRQALDDSAREQRFIETRFKLGYRFVATVYHRPTERLELLPPPSDPAPPPARTPVALSRRRLAGLAVVLLFLAGFAWWWLSRSDPGDPPAVLVGPLAAATLEPERQRQAENARRQILAGLDKIEGIIVSSVPKVDPSSQGLLIELSCHPLGDGSLELTATLREMPAGEAVWGWTWVVPEDGEAMPLTIAERVVRAVRARISH